MSTLKCFNRQFRRELKNLASAWHTYLGETLFLFIRRNRSFVTSCIVVVFFMGAILWVICSLVYAQPQDVMSESVYYYPVGYFVSWFAGGGLMAALARLARKNYNLFKRGFDLFAASMSIIVFFPLFVIIALLVKIDSPGPVFFKQQRIGQDGELFDMWKFRTMRHNAELETGAVWAQDSDPRITRIGLFLRKSHLDEIPQLFNVFKGTMSLIGPRPERPEMSSLICNNGIDFRKRLNVKPGITGLAQVRYDYGASIKDAARKLRYDMLYIRRMCLLLDLRIIFWTIGRVITGEGAR